MAGWEGVEGEGEDDRQWKQTTKCARNCSFPFNISVTLSPSSRQYLL